MNKRVHEIAKQHGLPAKEVLEKLRAAGIEVKAASSNVDEAAAQRVLGNGGSPQQASPQQASAAPSAPRQRGDGAQAQQAAQRQELRGRQPDDPRAAQQSEAGGLAGRKRERPTRDSL